MVNTMVPPFRQEREFGLLIGSVLVLFGGWWVYRGKFEMLGPSFVAAGIALIALGVLLPKALVYPNWAWLFLGKTLSLIITPIILGLIYFGIIMPAGLFRRLLGADPLGRRSRISESSWKTYHPHQRDPRHYEKMY